MKRILAAAAMLLTLNGPSFAQKEKMSREEKDEKNAARMERINNKNDIALFRKQIMALKEYALERQKIPAVQKANAGMAVKLSAVIDTDALESGSEVKVLTGYIRQDIGETSINMYELLFDRSQRKIVSVKRTPEAIDADKDANEEKEEKQSAKKGQSTVKKAAPKKNKDEDEDDDPDEEKPSKTRHKEADDD